MRIETPSDIILYKVMKCVKRTLLWFAVLSAFLLIAAYYRNQIAQNEIAKLIVSRGIPILFIIDYVLTIYKMIFGNWIGEIVSVEEKVKPKVISYSSNTQGGVVYIKSFLVTAKNGKGKTVKAKVYNPKEELVVGEKIIHIYGTKYAKIIREDSVRCVICGEDNPKENEKCGKCGHSLKITEA